MSIKTMHKVILAAALLCVGVSVSAQDGAYSGFTPYSIFGMGQMMDQGSAYNKTMGGVGIATRNKRYINYLNPAAITARDTLAFMTDFSVVNNNSIYRQGDMRSAKNIYNINDIVLSFPLWGHSAMAVGITPYSTTGYSYGALITDSQIIGHTGNAAYTASGQGSMYQMFASAAVTMWKRLSLGAEADYYFGNIDKKVALTFSDNAYGTINSGYQMALNAVTGKVGLQYEQPFGGGYSMILGATYKAGANVKGYVSDYQITNGNAQSDTIRFRKDTLGVNTDKLRMASEISVGLSFNAKDRWRAELDYTRSDWTGTGIDMANGFSVSGASTFAATCSEAYRAGFEIVPNRNDIRYYHKRMAYRGGMYYKKDYYMLDGNNINAYGVTFGVTLPVFRYYNGITLGVDLGSRGSVMNNMVRETYFNFSVGFNLFDYWFQKPKYD